MIRFRATLNLDSEELAETILKSTAIENRGYVDMRREGNMLEIAFEAKDYGSFLHTFNDLFVSILMILKL
ncbi:MAG: hypothetical protein SVE93_02110 [Candidatus Thermoplasmatota archaeon]|nr:hypothetical protein [Candidatus Thermoplasmatota archaeon]